MGFHERPILLNGAYATLDARQSPLCLPVDNPSETSGSFLHGTVVRFQSASKEGFKGLAFAIVDPIEPGCQVTAARSAPRRGAAV